MSPTRYGRLALVLALASALGGCSTFQGLSSLINPFDREENEAVASEGQRISIIAFDENVEQSDALRGQDFFLPPPSPIGDWPLPGATPEQSVEHVQAGDNLQIAWSRGFGQGSSREAHVTAPPVMAQGMVFVMDGHSTVAAIDAVSGNIVWRVDLPARGRRDSSRGVDFIWGVVPTLGGRDSEAFGGGMAYSNGKLYVASGNRYVVELDAATGAMGWRRDTASPIHGAPTVADGRVFVVSTDNELLAFNAASGLEDWNYQALVEPARLLRASTPAVSGDTVVAAFASGEVIALRTANGNDLWNQALSQGNRINALSEIRDIAGRPVIHKGDVFAASHSGVFAAIDLRSGQPRWSLPVAAITTPWAAGDVVYLVARNGEVICVARESGQIYWISDLNETAAAERGSRRGGAVFILGERARTQNAQWTSPILASGRLLTASSTGQLVALDPKTGEIIGSVDMRSSVTIGPIAAGGTVYFVTDEAELVAIR